MNKHLSLNQLNRCSESRPVGARLLLGLESADMVTTTLTTQMSKRISGIVAAEAFASFTKRHSESFTRETLKAANVALEQISEDISGDASIVFDTTAGVEVGAAVSDGLNAMVAVKADGFEKVFTDFSKILASLSEQRESLIRLVGKYYHRINQIEEAIESFKKLEMQPQSTLSEFGCEECFDYLQYADKGVVAKAATVCTDTMHFLSDHSHVFKRLIKKQTDWITVHKDNLLTDPNGFSQYSFNPVDYYTAGATPVGDDLQTGQVILRGAALPGNVSVYVKTAKETTFGVEAVEMLNKSSLYLQTTSEVNLSEEVSRDPVPVLAMAEIKARVAEAKELLSAIKHWSMVAHAKLWKDAIFEEEVLRQLFVEKGATTTLLGAHHLAGSVVSLLSQGTNEAGQYALRVADAVIGYAEKSLLTFNDKALS